MKENLNKAQSSQFHDLYSKLQYNVAQKIQYFQLWATSLIIKASLQYV